MKQLIVKSDADNVGNALEDIAPGDAVLWRRAGVECRLNAAEAVPFAFKMALCAIAAGQEIRCYGEPIGVACANIAAGALVHVHNVRGLRANANG